MYFLLNLFNKRKNCSKLFFQCLQKPLLFKVKALNTEKVFSQRKQFSCKYSTNVYKENSLLTKDVILFKYENPRFFKIINIFALSQFIFWSYLSFNVQTLKDIQKPNGSEELAWYQRMNLGNPTFKKGLTIFCFLIGYGILVSAWFLTLRSVRYLILRKGGREVSFVTYTPLNKNRIMTVPLKNISAEQSRSTAKSQLPIKVRNKLFYYVLDMKGEFKNAQLFDTTAGLKRNIKDI